MREFLNPQAAALQQGGIRAMFDRMAGREGLISLAVGEPDFGTHPDIVEAGCRALRDGFTHYTPNAGYLDLREAIVETMRPQGLSYDPGSEVIVTVGAMGALAQLFWVLLSPGDEVIVQEPVWVNYYTMISYPGGVPVPVRTTDDNGFRLRAADIEARITPRTKVLLLNNPGNPTGAYLKREELQEIAELAQKHDLLVISDEVYGLLLYDGNQPASIASFPGMKERTVVINGFSKAYAMTGWRIGYALGPVAILRKMVLLQENVISCVAAATQKAAAYALSRPDIVQGMVTVYEEKRNLLLEGLSRIEGVRCTRPGGAFYLFPDISSICPDSKAFCFDLLDRAAVACIPGVSFGDAGEGHIRMSYANSKENLTAAAERLQEYVRRFRRA